MTNYGGSFVQGLAGGLQTGFGMGQKIQEMRWQKEQMKKLEKEKELLQTNLSSILSDPANQEYLAKLSSGGDVYSPEGINFTATLFGVSKDLANYIADLQKDIHAGNRKDAEMKFENLKVLTEGMVDLNLEGMMTNPDFGIGNLASEESMRYKRAAETYKNTPKENMPYGMTKEVAGMAGLKGMPEAMPTTPDQPPTELELQADTQKKLDFAYNTGNASHFNQTAKSLGVDTTFDTYKQKYKKPEGTGGGTTDTEDIARTDIAYWEKTFDNVTSEEEYNRQYDLLKQSKTSKQYEPKPYKDMITNEVKDMANEIKGLLTSNNKFKNDEAKATYAKYQAIYEQKVRELIAKYPNIDISQFPKYLPVDQIKKVGFWKGAFTGGGVAKGDYSVIDTKGW